MSTAKSTQRTIRLQLYTNAILVALSNASHCSQMTPLTKSWLFHITLLVRSCALPYFNALFGQLEVVRQYHTNIIYQQIPDVLLASELTVMSMYQQVPILALATHITWILYGEPSTLLNHAYQK